MINKIVISTDGNIGITRKGIKAFGKKNCPSVPLVVGIHLWDRWKSLKVEARVREARYCVRAGNGMKQLPTDWSFSPPVSCAITLANSPAGNFNGYNWNRKTGRLPLVHAPPPPLLRIRNYPILRRGYKFRTSRERWEEKRGEKSLALNYFQSDLVVKGVEENFADWTIPFWERFRSICPLWISPSIFPCRHLVCENNWRKLVVFFQGCCRGNFYSRNVGRAARLRRISVSARMMSKDVSARRVSPVITRVKFEEQSIREERRKSYESAII